MRGRLEASGVQKCSRNGSLSREFAGFVNFNSRVKALTPQKLSVDYPPTDSIIFDLNFAHFCAAIHLRDELRVCTS